MALFEIIEVGAELSSILSLPVYIGIEVYRIHKQQQQ